jgi:hypothetical protein
VSRQAFGPRIVLDLKDNLKGGSQYTVKVTTGINDEANNLESPQRGPSRRQPEAEKDAPRRSKAEAVEAPALLHPTSL